MKPKNILPLGLRFLRILTIIATIFLILGVLGGISTIILSYLAAQRFGGSFTFPYLDLGYLLFNLVFAILIILSINRPKKSLYKATITFIIIDIVACTAFIFVGYQTIIVNVFSVVINLWMLWYLLKIKSYFLTGSIDKEDPAIKKIDKKFVTFYVLLVIPAILIAGVIGIQSEVRDVVFSRGSLSNGNKLFSGFSGDFDFSETGNMIVFRPFNGKESSVYTFDLDTNSLDKISESGEDVIFPRFSDNETKIIYVKADLESITDTKFVLSDLNKKQRIEYEIPHQFAVPPLGEVFSEKYNRVYFIGSSFYGNYDGFTKQAPHDNDLYYLDLTTQKLEKLTELSSYEMSDLQLSTDGEKLYFSYRFGKNDKAKDVFNIKFASLNIKTKNIDIIFDQRNSGINGRTIGGIQKQGNKFVITANQGNQSADYEYDLYTYDPGTNDILKLTNLGANISEFSITSNNVIVFAVNIGWPDKKEYKLMKVNIDGSNLEEIILPDVSAATI